MWGTDPASVVTDKEAAATLVAADRCPAGCVGLQVAHRAAALQRQVGIKVWARLTGFGRPHAHGDLSARSNNGAMVTRPGI